MFYKNRPVAFDARKVIHAIHYFLSNLLNILSKSPFKVRPMSPQLFLTRWSVMRSWGKLYVRIFSERSPEPICFRRSSVILPVASIFLISNNFERSISIAFSLFLCWFLSEREETTIPDGL